MLVIPLRQGRVGFYRIKMHGSFNWLEEILPQWDKIIVLTLLSRSVQLWTFSGSSVRMTSFFLGNEFFETMLKY